MPRRKAKCDGPYSLNPPEPEAKEATDSSIKRPLSDKPLPTRRVRHTGPSTISKPGPSGPTPEELIHIADEAETETGFEQWTLGSPTADARLLKMAGGLLEESPAGVATFKRFCELEAIASLRDFRKIDFSGEPGQSSFEGDDTGPGQGAWISEQAKVVRATKTAGSSMIVCGDPAWNRPMECRLAKNLKASFHYGPLIKTADSENKMLRVLGERVEGKALLRVSVEEKHRAWEMEDPIAKADKQIEFLAAMFRRRDSTSLQRSEQAAAALNLASECTHKAHLYAASLKEWARKLHPELPTDYFGIAIRLAYIRDNFGIIHEVKTYAMFVARKDGHNQASEVTQQTYSFQVVLALLGEDAFFWRPILVYPQMPEDIGLTYQTLHTAPCNLTESKIDTVPNLREWAGKVEMGAIAGRGGPWPWTLNLTPGGEGCGMGSVGDSSSGLLSSAGAFSVVLLLWVECEPDPELHKREAEYKGIKVGKLWNDIRSKGYFVRGYPLRVCALTEAKFAWDVHGVAQQKALAVLAKHIAARIEDKTWDGKLPMSDRSEVGRIWRHMTQGRYITGNPNLGNALLEMGVARGSWCQWLGPGF